MLSTSPDVLSLPPSPPPKGEVVLDRHIGAGNKLAAGVQSTSGECR